MEKAKLTLPDGREVEIEPINPNMLMRFANSFVGQKYRITEGNRIIELEVTQILHVGKGIKP